MNAMQTGMIFNHYKNFHRKQIAKVDQKSYRNWKEHFFLLLKCNTEILSVLL